MSLLGNSKTRGKDVENNITHDVFISYSGSKKNGEKNFNQLVADRIYNKLKAENIRCWMDYRDIEPGKDWADEISKAITQSRLMIVVLSSHTVNSHYVLKEVTQAANEDKTIIPFCIEKVSLDGGLKLQLGIYQWINAYPRLQEKHLEKLIETVHHYIETKSIKIVDDQPGAIEVNLEECTEQENMADGKKWILFVLLIIAIVLIIKIITTIDGCTDQIEIPKVVKSLKAKGIEVVKNDEGYWEADYGYGIKMIYIPAGKFNMGSNNGKDDEKPLHEVYLDAYWIGKTEVTVAQFRLFVQADGYETEAEKNEAAYFYDKYSQNKWVKKEGINWKKPGFKQTDDHPVVIITFNDATEYCKWLSSKFGLTFKLPTEAQWEKASRGNDDRIYPWGNHPPYYNKQYYANYCPDPYNHKKDGFEYTAPVGSYPNGRSPFGLLDMSGNVWEWCSDWYKSDYYKDVPKKNPKCNVINIDRVVRGGDWDGDLKVIRCATRGKDQPSNCGGYLGFRLCQDNQ